MATKQQPAAQAQPAQQPGIPANIIKALQQTSQQPAKPAHEFAIHVSDDGKQISTKERVVPGIVL